MDLLNRDGIKVEEISDYHIYPIADNDTPKLRNLLPCQNFKNS